MSKQLLLGKYDPDHLSYSEGKAFIDELYKSHMNTDIEKGNTFDLDSVFSIEFPGKKWSDNRFQTHDYALTFYKRPIHHIEICLLIVTMIINGHLQYKEAMDLLQDSIMHGLRIDNNDSGQTRFLKRVLFWSTLQEDINYYKKNQKGRLRAFKVFAQAIETTTNNSRVSFPLVEDNIKSSQIKEYELTDPPTFYHLSNRIE